MVDLGIPSAPPPTLAPRRKTKQLKVGSVGVGSDSQVSVQSMCTTLTADVNATLQQIAELTASGCQIVRVAVPSQDDADALAQIAKKSQIPVIADITFNQSIFSQQSMLAVQRYELILETLNNSMTKLKKSLKLQEMPEFQSASELMLDHLTHA